MRAIVVGSVTIGTTINRLVEGFVKAASVELPRGVRNQLRQPYSPDRVRGLPRLFHRLHPCSRCGSRACVSARHFDPNHRAHPEAA
jgi:hypothetical protein